MKLKIMMIDDSLTDTAALEKLIHDSARSLGLEAETFKFTSARSAKTAIAASEPEFDLVFVDVMMPEVSGTELIPSLRWERSSNTLFVLMSSQPSYMKDGYAIEAFDFICKPFTPDEVTAVIKRAVRKMNACRKGSLEVYENKTLYKVDFSDILTVVSSRNYAVIKTADKRYCARKTLTELLKLLPECFVRVSRNTVVNVAKVSSITSTSATFRSSGATVKVAKPYAERLIEAFKEIY